MTNETLPGNPDNTEGLTNQEESQTLVKPDAYPILDQQPGKSNPDTPPSSPVRTQVKPHVNPVTSKGTTKANLVKPKSNPPADAVLPDGSLKFTILGKKHDKEYIWKLAEKLGMTIGETLTYIIEQSQREPETHEVEREVIREVEKEIEKEVIREISPQLLPGQFLIQFDPDILRFARLCRKFLKRDQFLTAEDPEGQMNELVNRCILYFLARKYDHIVNPLFK